MNAVIEVSHLLKTYSRGKRDNFFAVNDISFEVYSGEIFGILGPNGAGKTTTLEILETLRKPSGGVARILGFDCLTQSESIKPQIGVQFQSCEYLPLLNLKEQLNLFASAYHSTQNPKELLAKVGLEDLLYEQVDKLSGGQKQRFSVATALVNNPKVLFLDEPTTGLDPSARRHLWGLVKEINASGITIVLTTHYMEEAEYLCNRVAIMDQGKILTIDNPKTLINNLSHTTQVSFFTDQKLDTEFWLSRFDIEKIYGNYPKVILEIKSLDSISHILNKLRELNVSFTGFTVKTATLEDVYLDLTGRELTTEHTN